MLKMSKMPYVIGLKFRIYPSTEQKSIITTNDSASRFIYNRLVARNRELYSLKKTTCYVKTIQDRIDYLESLGQKPSDLLAAYPFLADKKVDSLAIANSIKNYYSAWNRFSTVPGTSIPTFHKKGYSESYQTNAQYQKDATSISDGNVYLVDKNHIRLPKLGSVKFKGSKRIQQIFARTCETRIGTISILKDECGCYYVSLQIGSVAPFHKKLPATGKSIGIDMNIENFCTDSNGVVTENPKFRKKAQDKLAKAQKKLSRKRERAKKDGRALSEAKNYQKQRLKVAKLQKHIAAQREDFQHVVSKRIIESQDMIFVEALKVKNLIKNHHLAFAIQDCAWSAFFSKLEYKAKLYGRIFLRVNAAGTTQTCSECGYVLTGDKKLTLADREWKCPQCGVHHNRDHNAAKNIKNKGLALV